MKKTILVCIMVLVLLSACAKNEGFGDVPISDFHDMLLESVPEEVELTYPRILDRAGGDGSIGILAFTEQGEIASMSVRQELGNSMGRVDTLHLRMNQERYMTDHVFLESILNVLQMDKNVQKKIERLIEQAEIGSDAEWMEIQGFEVKVQKKEYNNRPYYDLEINELS